MLLVKDSLAERRPDGREESGVSWEYVFHVERGKAIRARWEEFKPTYRGREVDVPEGGLKTQQIKRVGLMMRRYVISLLLCSFRWFERFGGMWDQELGYYVNAHPLYLNIFPILNLFQTISYILPNGKRLTKVTSFFDAQSGPFDLPIRSIAAFKSQQSATPSHNSHFLTRTTSSTSISSSITRVASHTPSTVLAYQNQPEPEYKSEYPDEKAHLKMKDDEMKNAEQKLAKKEEKERRTQERNSRTGIGALTGEMRDRGEGGMPGWRGWVNWIGRGCF